MARKQELEIEGRKVPVSNLDKLMYPVDGVTKGQVIDYYVRVSQYLLPHFKDRPVTLIRYPDGVAGDFFYEKHAPAFTPDWVQVAEVPRRAGGTPIRYILINDLPTLVWCANLAAIELHPFLHRVPHIDRPTSVVFDLDPGEPAEILDCAEVAFQLKALLEQWGLKSFPKVSGSRGLQIYVPLNRPVTYAETQPFAKAVAERMAREHPGKILSEMAKAMRAGKVFIDWSQNSDFKTTVGVYSLRAKRAHPFVSMPVTWEALERALKKKNHEGLYFKPDAALAHLKKVGDVFAPVLTIKQSLPGDLRQPAKSASARTPKALEAYRVKRDFTRTTEPAPAPVHASRQGSRKRFVIQKHAASHLHYDFRPEMHGVLKSWAVPKGIPLAKNERRLAMATEDHPLEYIDFEGVIPQGEYGGGTVMIWDTGTYELVDGNYYKGHLHIYLSGSKLKGDWVLIKDKDKERNWYLIKVEDSMKPLSAKKENASAVSGRTMEQIAKDRDRHWHSNRLPAELAGLPDAKIEFMEPMHAKVVSKLPQGDEWRYEIKLDGLRALAVKDTEVSLRSEDNKKLHFPKLAKALATLPDDSILDGVIVALDKDGRPSMDLLKKGRARRYYYATDVLALRGKSLLGLPFSERRSLLERLDLKDPVRISATFDADPGELAAAAKKQKIGALIAKRADSVYEPGGRSGAWLEVSLS